jgi:hypothetical protein
MPRRRTRTGSGVLGAAIKYSAEAAMTRSAQQETCEFATAILFPSGATADDWLEVFLRNGPRLLGEIQRQSARAGFAWGSIRGAAELLGVRELEQRRRKLWKLR